jgi:carboxyl-terminal processing protease
MKVKNVLLSGAFFFILSAKAYSQKLNPETTTDKFKTLLTYISSYYVDTIKEDKLTEEAIIAMLEKLDPHSIYIPKSEVEEMNAPLKGNFDGIGIRFQIMKDTIMVINTINGGPSEKVGVKAGDKILKIDNEPVAGIKIKNNQVREKLMGRKGTKVVIEIMRKNEKKPLVFTIVRDKIPIYSIDAAYMVDNKTGYIKLSQFAETTMSEFNRAIDSLKKLGMENLIFDLQGNGGGYLNTAIDLCDEFLDGRKMIVYTEGRAFDRRDTYAYKDGKFEKGKLIILIDESSASASEIVSGAIQDWDRGLIVGRRSFGKGLVQKPITLPDGSMVRLTTQRYYTPTGRCIQKPYNEGTEAYHKEKYQRYLNGESFNKDSIKIPDSLKFYTRISKREVYGGGGIIPDVFVPLDTTGTSDYLSKLIRNGIFNNFSITYIDKQRKALKAKYPTFQKFKSDFKIDQKLMEEFINYAKSEKIEFNPKDFETSKYIIEVRLKATIAQNLWDYPMFFEIINELNAPLKKAIEIMNDGTYQKMKLAANN